MFRLAIYDVLKGYGLARPPIADDIADAVMKIYKKEAAQQGVQRTGDNVCPVCGNACGNLPMHIICDPASR